MENQTQTESVTASKNIRTLMAATADKFSEKIAETRKGLASALTGGERMITRVKEKAVKNINGTNTNVHKHPYEALAFALGVGALIGYAYHRFSQAQPTGINGSTPGQSVDKVVNSQSG